MRDGAGRCEYADGSVYNGGWKDNLRHGKGEMRHPNGDRFVGSFRLGEMEGEGTAAYDRGDRYAGGFEAGERCGVGRCVFASGTPPWNCIGTLRFSFHSSVPGPWRRARRDAGLRRCRDGHASSTHVHLEPVMRPPPKPAGSGPVPPGAVVTTESQSCCG